MQLWGQHGLVVEADSTHAGSQGSIPSVGRKNACTLMYMICQEYMAIIEWYCYKI